MIRISTIQERNRSAEDAEIAWLDALAGAQSRCRNAPTILISSPFMGSMLKNKTTTQNSKD